MSINDWWPDLKFGPINLWNIWKIKKEEHVTGNSAISHKNSSLKERKK